MDSAEHRQKTSLRDSGTWNLPISTSFTGEIDYAKHIAEMFTSANIPLNKLINPHVSLAKWTFFETCVNWENFVSWHVLTPIPQCVRLVGRFPPGIS